MSTTLILGAGASLDYGFPSGQKLISDIESKLEEVKGVQTIRDLLQRLKTFRPTSIDEFIKQFPNDSGLIKSVIAEALFEYEDPDVKVSHENDLYHYLCLNIPRDKYSEYKIVTFNYDRALEFSFQRFLQTFHGTADKAFKALESLEIIHIHGRLPALAGEESFKIPGEKFQPRYGLARDGYDLSLRPLPNPMGDNYEDAFTKRLQEQNLVATFALEEKRKKITTFGMNNFKFVHEGALSERAKKILDESSRIFFLGFGYHASNMDFLGLDWNKNPVDKRIVGTCYGVGKTRKRELESRYKIIKFVECKAMDLFKDYCHLTNPDCDDVS